MTRPSAPAGERASVIIRPAWIGDADGIARVHVESWRTTYRGIVPDDYLTQLSVAAHVQRWRSSLQSHRAGWCTFVAEDTLVGIVGVAAGGPERTNDPVYAGELYAIYLLEDHQRRGVGRDLTAAVARQLADGGMRAMLLWVLAGNPARRFYEALGGRVVRSQPIEIGGATLGEIAYGWTDTSSLIDGAVNQ